MPVRTRSFRLAESSEGYEALKDGLDAPASRRFAVDDKVVLINHEHNPFTVVAWDTRHGTVGGHLFDMVRVRSDDGEVDMFFPDWHVWLQSASVTGGPRPFDCDHLPDRPPDDEQDLYDEVNRLTGRDPDRDNLVPKALTAEGLAMLEKRVTELEASHPGVVRKALDPSVNPKSKWSFLHWVSQHDMSNYFAVAAVLLEKGNINPDCYDYVGITPLYNACCYGQAAVVAFLIQHGADGLRPAAGLLTPIQLMMRDSFDVTDEAAAAALRRRRTVAKSNISSDKQVTYDFKWLDFPSLEAEPRNFFRVEDDTGPWQKHVGGKSVLSEVASRGHLGLLDTPLLVALIDQHWHAYGRHFALSDAASGPVLIGGLMLDSCLDGVPLWCARGATLVVAAWLLVKERAQYLEMGRAQWMNVGWNVWEAAMSMLVVVYVLLTLLPLATPSIGSHLDAVAVPVLVLAVLLAWTRSLRYVSAIKKEAGVLVTIIQKMLVEFAIFLLVGLMLLLAFTHAFYVTTNWAQGGEPTFGGQLMISLRLLVGDFDYAEFESEGWLAVTLFSLWLMLGTILLLNLLIAHLSNVYSRVQADAKSDFRLSRVRTVLEAASMLSSAKREEHRCSMVRISGRSLPASVVESLRQEEMEVEEEARRARFDVLESSVKDHSGKLDQLAKSMSENSAMLKQILALSQAAEN